MKDLIKNRLTTKTEFLGARDILENLQMLINEIDIDDFNVKHMSDTEATFSFTTKVEQQRDMIITISMDYKDILFLLEYEGRGITQSMYLVKDGEVVNSEVVNDEIIYGEILNDEILNDEILNDVCDCLT